MPRALLIAIAAFAPVLACTATRDSDRRDAAALADGEVPPAELCTPGARGASAYDDDLDGAIDEGCAWRFGTASPIAELHTTTSPLAAPWLSDDKLRLYAVRTASSEIVLSARASRDSLFSAPSPVARWEGPAVQGLALARDELEIFVAREGSALARADRSGGDRPFGGLEPVPLDVAPPHYHPALSRDGTELFFVATGGDTRTRIFRTTRAGRGQPFGPASAVLPTDPSQNETTPQPTEDGRALFASLNGVLVRFDRAGPGQPFGPAEVLADLAGSGAAQYHPFVSLGTREIFFVPVARPWSPVPDASIWRAPICRDDACPDRPIPCTGTRSPDGQHCYVALRVALSWEAARADCQARGAHLATLHSADEHALVAGLQPGAEQWLGGLDGRAGVPECNLVDRPEGCAFGWGTGEPWTYAAWGAAQPSGTSPADMAREDCLALAADGTFDDRACASAHPYVCESEAYPTW